MGVGVGGCGSCGMCGWRDGELLGLILRAPSPRLDTKSWEKLNGPSSGLLYAALSSF